MCISVPRTGVGKEAATTLALVVHELVTNLLRHGAFSVEGGTLDVSCSARDGDVLILWSEQGGPAVEAATAPAGSGSRMVKRGMSDQLGGSIDFDWSKEGVIVTLRMNKGRLTA